jgi:hypothetical protein
VRVSSHSKHTIILSKRPRWVKIGLGRAELEVHFTPTIQPWREIAGRASYLCDLISGEIVPDVNGKHPKGFAMYGKDGRFMVMITDDGRPKPESTAKMTDGPQMLGRSLSLLQIAPAFPQFHRR